MAPNPDLRWKQRFQNFDRAFVLLRDAMENGPDALNMLDHRNLLSHTYSPLVFEQAVEAIHTRYLAGLEQLHEFLQGEAMR